MNIILPEDLQEARLNRDLKLLQLGVKFNAQYITDIYGIDETVEEKHWKCSAPMIIDARIKPHHQKQLTVPAEITAKAKQILKDAGVL